MKRTVARMICGVKKTTTNLSHQTMDFVSDFGNKINKIELEGELSILYEKLGKLYMSVGSSSTEFTDLVAEIKIKEDALNSITEKEETVCDAKSNLDINLDKTEEDLNNKDEE